MIFTDGKIFILAVNAGSTSFKFKLFEMTETVCVARGKFERIGSENSPYEYKGKFDKITGEADTKEGYLPCIETAMGFLLHEGIIEHLSDIDAVVFKTVMAGADGKISYITDSVIEKLLEYSKYAPAHNPAYISVIKAFRKMKEDFCLIAAFDSEFHKSIPDYARMYPIDRCLAEKYGIVKYGYHGAAHEYTANVSQKLGFNKVISCHLGGSSSVTAIKDGMSIDTSMGFSPQSGLAMAERCGDIDPFAVFYLMEKEKLSVSAAMNFLTSKSGLYGMSGISDDLRDITASGEKSATLSIKSFAYGIKKYIGAYLAVLSGCDAIFFSGGIGENSPLVRQLALDSLEPLGIKLSREKNNLKTEELNEISEDDSKVKVFVSPANEELIIAKRAYDFIGRNFAAEM